jgi:WhiB family redox-sensing transcriptional regulator
MNHNAERASGGNWRGRAACRNADPELFFPEGTSGPALRQTSAAIQICGPCPVRSQCLSLALDRGYDYGIWGGVSAEGRRAIRRVVHRPRSA